ncbi:MAG: hypothetical protein WCP06_05030 [Verrucomicrobiota bacterium]
MKTSHSRIANLKEMIALEEKRAVLESQIAGLDQRLAALQSELYGAASVKPVPAPKLKDKPAAKGQRKRRGALRGQILEALQAAGPKGVAVLDLAKMLGTKPANIHSWFSVNFKKTSGLKKVGAAQYALNGGPAPKAVAPKAAAPKKAGRPAIKAKAGRPAAKAKSGKASTGRGELKNQILDELKKAGDAGITIKDLSEKLGAKYKNLYIWFVTTGKRIAEIKKVGPARYKLQAA